MRPLCMLDDNRSRTPDVHIVEDGEGEIWRIVGQAGPVVALAKPDYLDALGLTLRVADIIMKGPLGNAPITFLVRGGLNYVDVFDVGTKRFGQGLCSAPSHDDPGDISTLILQHVAAYPIRSVNDEGDINRVVGKACHSDTSVVVLAQPNPEDARALTFRARAEIANNQATPGKVIFLVRPGYAYFDMFRGGRKLHGQALGPNHPDNNPAAISKMVLNLATVH